MVKVYNNIIPLKGFVALTMWPLLFIRKAAAWLFDAEDENHENIHGAQQKEMLIVGAILAVILAVCGCGRWSLFALPLFLYWYGVEWLIKYCYYRDTDKAYKNGALEREAYANQNDMTYLSHRRPFAWVRYIVN